MHLYLNNNMAILTGKKPQLLRPGGGVLGLPDDGYVPPDFSRSGQKAEKNGPLKGLKWRKIRIFVNFMTLVGTFFLEI